MDLARRGDLAAADADFQRTQDVDLGDYFELIVQRVELAQEDKAAGGAGLRYSIRATLAGRVFEQVMVDVGFAPSTIAPDIVEGLDLLDFAGIEPVRVPALPVTLHVAEKVHAYTRRYRPHDAPSSRPKDLVDLVLLATHESFSARALRGSLDETFLSRSTHPLPSALPSPPPEWERPYTEMARQVGIASDMTTGYVQAQAFLDPILSGRVRADEHWKAAGQCWASS